MFKRIFIILISVVLCIASFSSNIFATEIPNQNEFFQWTTNPNTRINPDGSFYMYFHYNIESGHFIVNDLPFVFQISAHVYDTSTNTINTSTNHTMTITFYEEGILFDEELFSITVPLDGENHAELFRVGDFEIGKEYSFSAYVNDPNFHLTAYYAECTGSISGITPVN